jgi:hypothetical protein
VKRNVNNYENWWKRLNETEEDLRTERTEFGLEGGGKHGVALAQNSEFKDGEFIGAERFWASRGETRIDPRSVADRYDLHVYYTPNEFQGWYESPQFSDFDTRGLRYYWKELSGGKPVVVLVPGTGERFDHKSAEFIAYEEVFQDLMSIPEFREINRFAEVRGGSSSVPKELTMGLIAKVKEMGLDLRIRDIFDKSKEDPEYIKAMVKESSRMGLI